MSESSNWPAPDPIQKSLGTFQSANFGQRLGASVADFLNILGLYLVVLIPSAILQNIVEPLGTVAIICALVFVVFTRGRWEGAGGSPLRRKSGIIIVDKFTGEPIGTKRGLIRLLCRIPSGMIYFLGYFWMIWDRNSETWHDKMSHTKVVVKR
jgi:uncharacterized RDD family membrane protein YckC